MHTIIKLRHSPDVLSLAVLFCTLFVYTANTGYLYTYDSAPTSLAVFNALQNSALNFDAFRGSYLYALGAGYVFKNVHGHLFSIFPIGTAILTAPIYCIDFVLGGGKQHFPTITAIAFESSRLSYEKHAAALIAATSAAVFYLCAVSLTSKWRAVLTTIVFAFGSQMWAIGSQALWQHGAVNLVMLISLLGFLRGQTARRARNAWLFLAGLAAGFLPVIRPTAIIFTLALGIAGIVVFRARSWLMFPAFVVGIAPAVIWNFYAFGTLLGGYDVNTSSYAFSLAQFEEGMMGLALSPSKGLVCYAPFVLLSGLGLARVPRGPHRVLLASIVGAAILTFVNYAFFTRWLGGSAFGPRYLTDIAAAVTLPLIYVIPERLQPQYVSHYLVLAIVFAYGILVQFVGIAGEPKSNWSAIPVTDDTHLERVWMWRDSQIERDARTAYALWRPNPTADYAYGIGYSGRIDSATILPNAPSRVTASKIAPSTRVTLRAAAHNDGRSTWYGYTTGLYYGQARVRAKIFDEHGQEFGERYLYIPGIIPSGASAEAVGDFIAPDVPGKYRIRLDVDCYQNATAGNRRNDESIVIPLVVASAS